MPHRCQNIVKYALLLALAGSCLAATPLAQAQKLSPPATLVGAAHFLQPDLIIEDWNVLTLRPLDTGVAPPSGCWS